MNKVKLVLQDLQVESFEAGLDPRQLGTVQGLDADGKTVHSGCFTHCATDGCEACNSVVVTHCDVDCPSWNGSCTITAEADITA